MPLAMSLEYLQVTFSAARKDLVAPINMLLTPSPAVDNAVLNPLGLQSPLRDKALKF